jgi:acyl transferase domain-containing protein/NAD(P)-dependent dehydrogenase (short-subunit alcohol dehydrogenase family)/ubiquinone/menaquinone biosynthesis C-methylase UbiE
MSENDIAVVGMAGRFPGAGNVRQFWQNLRDGVESVKTYSLDELKEVGAPLQLIRDKDYVPASAPLEGIDLFDAGLFGISPNDAKMMNPQLRVLLECAWEALDDACIEPIREGPATGVFVGGSSNDYILPLILSDIPGLHSQNSLRWGIWNDSSFLATRVSYHLNLGGPSLTVQTACSTALVCVHQACSALLSGDCNVALAGAVSITLLEKRGYLFRREGIMSQDGHCRPFDQGASGTVEGDGVGLVVLKRLDDAVARHHDVRAIIKGSRINNDGNLKLGFSAPSAKAQAAVISGALRDAGVRPQEIRYIEAHGTGTVLGDAIELDALNDVFKVDQPKPKRWFLGSVKGNIGHLDAAAGIAGLIKSISILEQRHIPPTLIVKQQDEKDQSQESRFVCNRNGVELPEKNGPIFVGVSSFGIGGTNAHVVLSGAQPRIATRSMPGSEVIVLSAKSEAGLRCSIRNLALHLREHENVCLADVALSLRTGRRHLPYRYALGAETRTEVIKLLEKCDLSQAGGETRPLTLYFPHYKVASLQPFQTLFQEDQVFRGLVTQRLRDASVRAGIVDLTRLFRAGGWGDHLWKEWRKASEIEMLVSTVVQLCLAETWLAFGVEPAQLLADGGGSIAAGGLTARSFLNRPALRDGASSGETIGLNCEVEVSASELTAALDPGEMKRAFKQLEVLDKGDVLQINGPSAIVDKCLNRLDALNVSYSPRVGIPVGEDDRRLLGSAMNAWLAGDTAPERAKLGALQEISEHGSRVLTAVELAEISGTILLIGGVAEESLQSFTRAHADLDVFGYDESSGGDYKSALLNSWARLWMRRKLPDTAAIWAPSVHGRLISLPSYPFDRKSFWLAERGAPLSARLPIASDDADAQRLCYSITWEESPLAGYRNGSEGTIAVLPHPSFAGLASAIARVSPQVKVIGSDAGSHGPSEGSKEPTLQSMFGDLKNRWPHLPVILYGRMLFPPPGNTQTRVRLERFLDGEFAHLTCTLKALATVAEATEARLIVPCNGLLKILRDDILLPERALLLGLVQAARREFPAIKAWLVDVELNEDGTINDEVVECLVKEAWSNHDELIVGYRAGKRYSRRFMKSDFAHSASSIPLREGGNHIITGGLGGVGSQLASCLAEHSNVRLFLLTRPTKAAWRRSAQEQGSVNKSSRSAVDPEKAPVLGPQAYDELLDEALARREELLGGAAQNRSEWIRQFEKLSLRKTTAMLRRLLAADSLNGKWSTAEIIGRLEIQEGYERLLLSLLYQLEQHNEIDFLNSSVTFCHDDPLSFEGETEIKKATPLVPEASAALELIDQAVSLFPKVVRGEISAREALRSDTGGNILWDKARELSDYSLLPWYLHIAATWLRRRIEVEEGGTLQVLEVGGGTGVLTSVLLKLADEMPFSYLFTDVLLGQVEKMRRLETRRGSRFLCQTLDFNRDVLQQGFPAKSCDVIVAYNSLHLAKDIKASISHLSEVVQPGGYLLMLENTRERIWNTLTWGLLPEYWLSTEKFRVRSPLLDLGTWRKILEAVGLKWIWGFSKDENLSESSDLALMVYQFPATAQPRAVTTTAAEQSARKQQRVAELESRGATVEVIECDVADSVGVRECLRRLTAEYGPIRGVIHAAGTPDASLIRSMTAEDIRVQLSAKVFGTIALLEHLDLESLDFIVFCSAGERPNALAQTCYVGANRFMDATAECLQNAGCKAVSIGWERWHGTGMAEAVERAHKQVTGKELEGGITSEQGKAIFRRVMRSIPSSYVLVSAEPLGVCAGEEGEVRAEETQSARDMPVNAVTMEEIVEDLSNLWSRVLGVESLDPQANILELGGHSLITTQVVNAMHAKHPKANLKLRDVYDNPTVASLAEVIRQRCLASPSEMQNGAVENLDSPRSRFLDLLRRSSAARSNDSAIIDSETIWTIKKDLNFIAYPHELSHFGSIAQAAEYLEDEWGLQNSLRTTPEWASPDVLDAMMAQRRLFSTDAESTKLKEAVFLISAPRSGSTLLKSILGMHPAMVCPPELSLLLHDTLDTLVESLTGPLARQSLTRTFSELLHTESETGERLLEALVARKTSVAEVYRILQALANPAVLLDKCPNYSLDPRVIARAEALFTNPRYIILTRHPAAVIESFVRNRMHRLYTLDKVHPVWFAKEIYRRSLQTIISLQQSIDVSRVHVVRFEDLVRDPDGTTSQIFEFLNVASLREPVAMPPDRFSGSVSDPDFLRHDSIESAKSNEWQRLSLPFSLDEEISNMASSLGYEI